LHAQQSVDVDEEEYEDGDVDEGGEGPGDHSNDDLHGVQLSQQSGHSQHSERPILNVLVLIYEHIPEYPESSECIEGRSLVLVKHLHYADDHHSAIQVVHLVFEVL
jgi:hypothetical protein